MLASDQWGLRSRYYGELPNLMGNLQLMYWYNVEVLLQINVHTCSFRKQIAVSIFAIEGGSRNGNLTERCEKLSHTLYLHM